MKVKIFMEVEKYIEPRALDWSLNAQHEIRTKRGLKHTVLPKRKSKTLCKNVKKCKHCKSNARGAKNVNALVMQSNARDAVTLH